MFTLVTSANVANGCSTTYNRTSRQCRIASALLYVADSSADVLCDRSMLSLCDQELPQRRNELRPQTGTDVGRTGNHDDRYSRVELLEVLDAGLQRILAGDDREHPHLHPPDLVRRHGLLAIAALNPREGSWVVARHGTVVGG